MFINSESTRILLNLGLISQLKANDKLISEEEFSAIYTPTTFRAAFRFIYRETRGINLVRISECINSAKIFVTNALYAEEILNNNSISSKFQNEERKNNAIRTIQMLKKSIKGLENLEETYIGD